MPQGILHLVDGVASIFPSIEEWSAACGESTWQTCQQTISNIQKRVPSCDAELFTDEVPDSFFVKLGAMI